MSICYERWDKNALHGSGKHSYAGLIKFSHFGKKYMSPIPKKQWQ